MNSCVSRVLRIAMVVTLASFACGIVEAADPPAASAALFNTTTKSPTPTAATTDDRGFAIRVGKLYPGDGTVVENAMVIVSGGKIQAVGSGLAIPVGFKSIEVAEGSLTAGLIDANSRIESADVVTQRDESPQSVLRRLLGASRPKVGLDEAVKNGTASSEMLDRALHGGTQPDCDDPVHEAYCELTGCVIHSLDPADEQLGCCAACSGDLPLPFAVASGLANEAQVSTEQASEVVPHTAVIDEVDLTSPDFQRLTRGGVTTVYVSPDASAVIGPRGAIVTTGGPIDQRVLQRKSAVKATIGLDPVYIGSRNRPGRGRLSSNTRRPNTRMGVVWVFRKALFDSILRAAGRPASGGADTPSVEASDVLVEVLNRVVPLRIQARSHADILTAIRLSKEFDLPFILEEATEASKCIDELRDAKVPVVFGPIYDRSQQGPRSWFGETEGAKLNTLTALRRAGVKAALSAQERREEDGLARQAMAAMRFGLSLQEALEAVTRIPAEILGISDQVGTVEAGKRADLVVWNGEPFAATSRPLVVLIDGQIVVDRRSSK